MALEAELLADFCEQVRIFCSMRAMAIGAVAHFNRSMNHLGIFRYYFFAPMTPAAKCFCSFY